LSLKVFRKATTDAIIKILTESGVPNIRTARNSSTSRSDLAKSFAESDNQSLHPTLKNTEQGIPKDAFFKFKTSFPCLSENNRNICGTPGQNLNASHNSFNADQLGLFNSIEKLKSEHRKSKVLLKVSNDLVMHLTAGNAIIQSLIQMIAGYLQNLKFFLDLSFGLQNLFSALMIAIFVQLLGNSSSLLWIILTVVQFNLILVLLRNAKVQMHLKSKVGSFNRFDRVSTHELFDLIVKKVEKKISRLLATSLASLQRIVSDSSENRADQESSDKLFWIKREGDKEINGYLQLTLKQNSVYLKFFAPLDLEMIDQFEILRQDLATLIRGLFETRFQPSFKLSMAEDMMSGSNINHAPSTQIDSSPIKPIAQSKKELNIEEVCELKSEKSKLVENEKFNADSFSQPAVKEQISSVSIESLDPESIVFIDSMFDRKFSVYQEYTANISDFRIEEEKSIYKIFSRADPIFITKMCKLSINAKTSQILEALSDLSVLKVINPLMDSYQKVKQYSENHWVSSLIIKAPFPMSNREFTNYSVTRQIDEKRTVLMTFQCSEKICPLNKKYVRGYFIRRYGLCDLGSHPRTG